MARGMRRVDFFRHGLGRSELAAVKRVLSSPFLTYGPRAMEVEALLCKRLDVPHAVALNSCTTAIFLALRALDIGKGDTVVTTPLTFVATANAVLHTGARVIFADVDPLDGNLDPEAAEDACRKSTRAILPVHLYGRMVDVRTFARLASRKGAALIEDAAHCLEGSRDGINPGQLSDAAVFSFYATKNITSGEGGALVARDERLAARVRKISTHGLSRAAVHRHHGKFTPWDAEEIGFKANLSDIQAAILIPQLERLQTIAAARERAHDRYVRLLIEAGVTEVRVPGDRPGSFPARHLFAVFCARGTRDALMRHLIQSDIGVGVHYSAVHLTSLYRREFGFRSGQFPVAEDLGARTLSLPFYEKISSRDQERVVDAILKFYRGRKSLRGRPLR